MESSLFSMNTTLNASSETTLEPTEASWADWFEADHFPFTVQASIEEALLTNPAFSPLQPLLKSKLSGLLAAFADTAKTEGLLSVHGLAETFASPESSWEFEWMLCTNETMQAWNTSYRQKASPTDVLSFPTFETEATLLAATEEDPLAMAFFNQQKQTGGSLGTIVVSWDYACQAVKLAEPETQSPNFQEKLMTYILERFCHGCLHLLGLHHETQEKFDRVISLQALTLTKTT
jgi:rRNA maturation RNase YbeY